MRFVFAGTRSFGADVLRVLHKEGHDPIRVIAPPGDPVAIYGAQVAQSDTPVVHEATPDLGYLAPIMVCAHTHAYIGARTRNAFKLGVIGYHPSLLPRHRGRDAVRWTTHMNDPVAGGTVYWFNENVDGGPIESQRAVVLRPGLNYHDLWRDHLYPMGIDMLVEALARIEAGTIVKQKQDEKAATWEPSWERTPLMRPELIEIGPMPEGYRLETTAR